MNGLCLFAGICGIELGLKSVIPDFRTVCYVENDRYAQGVIMSRIRSGELDDAPIWDDVRTFDGRPWRGCVDIITGGFPCQDVSLAGKRAGLTKQNRSGLWFEYARLIREIRPRFVFVENVTGLLSSGFGQVLGDLAESGYDAEWCVWAASDVGAKHERKRVFCLAYAEGGNAGQSYQQQGRQNFRARSKTLPDTASNHVTRSGNPRQWRAGLADGSWWAVEPDVGRVAHGVQFRVDRLRCLGNAVVPQQAAKAWEILYSRIA